MKIISKSNTNNPSGENESFEKNTKQDYIIIVYIIFSILLVLTLIIIIYYLFIEETFTNNNEHVLEQKMFKEMNVDQQTKYINLVNDDKQKVFNNWKSLQ